MVTGGGQALLLGDVCGRFNWRCHADCEMTFLYHVVVEIPGAILSTGMPQLSDAYTKRLTRRHRLVGHLFQGRFKAILVEREAYLLELSRYGALNPVRAAMVGDASVCTMPLSAGRYVGSKRISEKIHDWKT